MSKIVVKKHFAILALLTIATLACQRQPQTMPTGNKNTSPNQAGSNQQIPANFLGQAPSPSPHASGNPSSQTASDRSCYTAQGQRIPNQDIDSKTRRGTAAPRQGEAPLQACYDVNRRLIYNADQVMSCYGELRQRYPSENDMAAASAQFFPGLYRRALAQPPNMQIAWLMQQLRSANCQTLATVQ